MDLYKALFKQTEDALLIIDGDVVIDCNRSLCELWDHSRDDDIIGKNIEWLFSNDYITSGVNILDSIRSCNSQDSDVEWKIECNISFSKNKEFLAEMKLSRILNYTVVVIKPKEPVLSNIQKVSLGGQEVELTIESLLQFITQLFDRSSVGIAIKGLSSGEFITANSAFFVPLQYKKEELEGLSFEHLTPEKYRDSDRSAVDSLINTGSFAPYQKEYECKDGSRITVEIYGGLILKGINQDFAWSFIEDVTDEENIKLNLNNKIKLMDIASNQTSTGVWELNLVSGCLQWSDETFQIYELDKDNFIPSYKAFLELVHPADRDSVNNVYQQSLVDHQPYQLAHRLQMPDGRIKFVKERGDTRFDETGSPLISIGTVQDITTSNNSRAEMERSPILEASRDFIGIADLDGRVTFINQAGRDMVKINVNLDKEILMFYELYDESDQKIIEIELIPEVVDKGTWQGELKLKGMLDSELVIVDCDVFRINDPVTDEPICYATVSQNITIRKIAELELQAYKDSLEQTVKERTIAFHEANLNAVQANKAKSIFLSRMSHELRTPLNAVLGFSQLIKNKLVADDDFQLDSINEVLLAGGHLLNLINDILDISRIESGRIQIKNEDINIGVRVLQSLNSLSSSINKKDIRLTVENFDNVFVKGDFTKIIQVLTYILSNAIKYNKQHGSIDISLGQSKNNTVNIIIKDTGIGIEESKLKNIFNPFECVDYDTYEGAGIGLTLVKELMKLMGGAVKIESLLDRGTTVLLEFIASNIEEKHASIIESKSFTDNLASKITILYIEDVSANMRLMSRILEKLGDIKLIEAKNGKSGIDAAKKYVPTIILLDINLPDMNGFDVLSALRDFDKTKDIPIIAVSANAFPEDIDRALKEGFDEYITKPFESNKLLSKVNLFIKIR
jgi:PAS domain S-box-containing protein